MTFWTSKHIQEEEPRFLQEFLYKRLSYKQKLDKIR